MSSLGAGASVSTDDKGRAGSWSRRMPMGRLSPTEIVLWAGSIAGYAFAALAWWFIERDPGGELLRVGPDLGAYLRAGTDLLAGRPVYVGQIGEVANFPYAPPWAVIAAGLTFLPALVVQVLVIALDFIALRYLARSWRGVGWLLLWPFTVYEISAGNIDLLIAAAIVLAWSRAAGPVEATSQTAWARSATLRRGLAVTRMGLARVTPLALMAFAKLAPALALPPARWRAGLVAAALCGALTLPVLHVWPEWVGYLLRQPATISISLPLPPWYWRLPLALVLAALGSLVLRRPWLSAVAVVVALPSLYLLSSVVLFAPIRLWLDGRGGAADPARPAPQLTEAPLAAQR